MRDFLIKWKFLGLIVLLIVLLFLCRSCGTSNSAGTVESVARETWQPVSAVGDFFGGIFDFSSKKALEKENAVLKEELAQVKTESEISGDITEENEKLRGILELENKHSSDWKVVAAEVTNHSVDNWYERFTINKGSEDGIEENLAVVDHRGLVGKTANVTKHTSEVVLIIDSSGSLGGMLQESSIQGVLKGIGGGKGLIAMEKLPYNADIQLNDIVVTSGTGGVFPGGILVGSVVKVNISADGLSKEAIVEPYCDFDDIEFVLVVRPLTAKEQEDKLMGNTGDEGDDETGGNEDDNEDGEEY